MTLSFSESPTWKSLASKNISSILAFFGNVLIIARYFSVRSILYNSMVNEISGTMYYSMDECYPSPHSKS